MARSRYKPDDSDDYSDGSDYSDDVSLSNEADNTSSKTSLTDINDFSDDVDIEDQVQLFEGNAYSREYYLRGLKEFNKVAFDDKDYSLGNTILLDIIEEI